MSYTTFQRWHASWEAPFIATDWRITDLPFVDGQVLLGARLWMQDQVRYLRVGEVPTWADARTERGLVKVPAGLNGKHVCHPEWFATGEPWPTSLPDTIYGPDGWPLCCQAGTDGAQGGFEIGGSAGDLLTYTDATVGGMQVGGSAGDKFSGVTSAQGGLVVGGASGDTLTTSDLAAGGMQVGGSAGDVLGYIDPAAGGLVVGGAAGDTLGTKDAAAGGLVVGGASGDTLATKDAAAGGLVVGGSAGDVFVSGYLLDLFVDPDGTDFGTHLMNVGPGGPNTKWTSSFNNGWWIQSNSGTQHGRTTDLTVPTTLLADSHHGDESVKALLTRPGSGNSAFFLVARASGAASHYQFGYDTVDAKLYLRCRSSGVVVTVASVAFAWAAGAQKELSLYLNGSDIRGFVNGVQMLAFTDTHFDNSFTQCGLASYNDASTYTTNASYNNFRALPPTLS